MAEFWSYDVGALHRYLSATGGAVSLFDAPLHANFHQASSSGGLYDMRRILDGTLMKEQPARAVTLVDNHDTQPCQALESPVADWFKPLAYAVILLRAEGYPNVFFADYYGARYDDCREVEIRSHREVIDRLLGARKRYAYGRQLDYLDRPRSDRLDPPRRRRSSERSRGAALRRTGRLEVDGHRPGRGDLS